jgi:hypothetical protein
MQKVRGIMQKENNPAIKRKMIEWRRSQSIRANEQRLQSNGNCQLIESKYSYHQ